MGLGELFKPLVDFLLGLAGLWRGRRREQAETKEIEARARGLEADAALKVDELEARREVRLQKRLDDTLEDLAETRAELDKVLATNIRVRALWRRARAKAAEANARADAADERYYVLLIKCRAAHKQLKDNGIEPIHEPE